MPPRSTVRDGASVHVKKREKVSKAQPDKDAFARKKIDRKDKQRENARKLHRPLMIFFIVVSEILIFTVLIVRWAWLSDNRGGFDSDSFFDQEIQRDPKAAINLHSMCMTMTFLFFIPQEHIALIVFEGISELVKKCVVLMLKLGALTFFIIGLNELDAVDQDIMSALTNTDRSTHAIISLWVCVFYITLWIIYVTNVIVHFYQPLKSAFVLGYFIRFLINHHVRDAFYHVLQLLAELSNLTGLMGYMAILAAARNYNIAHIFHPLREGDRDKEKDLVTAQVGCITCLFIISQFTWFYRHDILYHTGIITFHIYHKQFQQICNALDRLEIGEEDEEDFAAELIVDLERMQNFGAIEMKHIDARRRDQEDKGMRDSAASEKDKDGKKKNKSRRSIVTEDKNSSRLKTKRRSFK